MRILLLQLKRIGDLVLTTPALAALRRVEPTAHIGLGVMAGCHELLPAITGYDTALVFGPGFGWAPWQQSLAGHWDAVLDFTGNDRSAAAAFLSRARTRATFDWVKKKAWLRRCAYTQFVASEVREHHTTDHYLHLLRAIGHDVSKQPCTLTIPPQAVAEAAALLHRGGIVGDFLLAHPGTARADKYWLPERWSALLAQVREQFNLPIVFTGGGTPEEKKHLDAIYAPGALRLDGLTSLPGLTALAARARLVVSCDTGIVHLAAACHTPQIALYGPINPFHWRPRHPRAVVLSAAHPEGPLTEFTPKMKGAEMSALPTATVWREVEKALTQGKS